MENTDETMKQTVVKAAKQYKSMTMAIVKITNKSTRVWHSNHLIGYFESVVWPDQEIFLLTIIASSNLFDNLNFNSAPEGDLSRLCASPGKVGGKIKIVSQTPKTSNQMKFWSVNDTIDYLPLMQKAAGIITEQGNILSHAAAAN